MHSFHWHPPRMKMQQCWSRPAVTRGGALAVFNQQSQQQYAFFYPKYKGSVPNQKKTGGLKAISCLLHKEIASGSNKCKPQITRREEGHLLRIPSPHVPISEEGPGGRMDCGHIFPCSHLICHFKAFPECRGKTLLVPGLTLNSPVLKFCPTEMRKWDNLFAPCSMTLPRVTCQ